MARFERNQPPQRGFDILSFRAIDELLDERDRRTRGARGRLFENDRRVGGRHDAEARLVALAQRARPFRIELHEQKTAAVMEHRNVGMMLLKEAAVLHYDVQLLRRRGY